MNCDFLSNNNIIFGPGFVVAILNLVGLFLLCQIDWPFAFAFFGSHSECNYILRTSACKFPIEHLLYIYIHLFVK